MSDNGSDSGTPQRDVDKFIKEALKVWEEFGFKDMDLWETFQEDFDGFTEEEFKSASTHHQRKLRTYLRKYGVWVRKQQRYSIARSLYDALLEEEPTKWTEEEITACEEDENFDSYKISRLIDSDFGRKPRKSRARTPTSPTGPKPAATPSAPAPFASPSPTPGPSAQAPANTPINPTQPLGTGPTSGAYMQPPGIEATPGEYIQPSGPKPAAYIQPSGTGPPPTAYTPSGIGPTPAVYGMQQSGARPAAHTQLLVIKPTPAVHTQPSSTGPTHVVQILSSAINPPAAITTTCTGYAFSVDPPPATNIASTGNTPNSLLGPPAAVNLSVPAPFVSSSASPTPPGKASVSTSSASPTPAPVNAANILPSTTPFIPAPTPSTETGYIPTVERITNPGSLVDSSSPIMTTPSTSHGKELSRFSVDPPQAMITTSTGHGKELPNLAKICTDEVKCSGRNDSFTFKLAIFHDICSRADVLSEAKMKAFPTMLKGPALNNYPSNIGISGTVMNSDQVRYSIRRKWIKWDKTQNEMDETRIGVG